jgi:hypothetical protein
MATRLMRYAALVGLLASSTSTSRAEGPAADATSLQVRWETEPARYGVQTVCGRVLNERAMSAGHVRLRVEGLDEHGGVTGHRDGEVLGQVPSQSSGLFCITMFAGAASYRVTVIGVDWMAESDSP